MIDKKIISIINKEIDGEASEKELNKIRKYLDNNPEALKFYHGMLRANKLLNKVESVDPPASLKQGVINSIDINRYKKATKENYFYSLLGNILNVTKPKLAYVFITGIFAGILLYSVFFSGSQKQSMELEELIGTIGIYESPNITDLKEFSINLSELEGNITVKKLDNLFPVLFDLEALSDCRVNIKYDPNSVTYVLFNTNNSGEYFQLIKSDYFQAEFQGKAEFSTIFRLLTSKATLSINLSQHGQVIHTDIVQLTKTE